MNPRKRKILSLLTAIIITGICCIIWNNGSKTNDSEMQEALAEKLLRFHVIANSDSDEDQALKMKVKEATVNYLKDYLTDEMTLEESKTVVLEHNDEVLNLARKIIEENGYDYEVTGEITRDYFPVKSYGDLTLPAGEYDAYKICIGASSGKNWWCILYPTLCFVDVSYGYVPDESKLLLHNILDDEEYQYILGGENTEYRFKIFEVIKEWVG